VEGARAGNGRGVSTVIAEGPLASGKGDADENFPVARLFAPKFRAPVKAFYRFARTGDDIADHPGAPAAEKLTRLEAMRATLAGESDADAPALALRRVCEEREITVQHGLDLLIAFTRDVTKARYATWDELIDYCRVSAMPVGRFVLDVHGEERALWPANDALCVALQVINHLQDCAKDKAALDRVYLPADALTAEGASVADLDAPRATPALRRAIVGLARRTMGLLDQSRPFARAVRDTRLGVEVAIIQRLADDLGRRLLTRDPLSERVHHGKVETFALAARGLIGRLLPA
jgi:squalene synthase HpnC